MLGSSALAPLGYEVRSAWVLALFIFFLWMEFRRPLRRSTQSKKKRVFINISVAATAALILRFGFYPIVVKVAETIELKNWGLLPTLGLPALIEIPLALIALDYTLYLWHQLLHKIPFLWRFHNAHHADLDMDTSTALRFHFGELILSVVYRSAQILVFGISVYNLVLFETLVTLFALFHHSNIRLPIRPERILSWFIITPRVHGIHHSIVQKETDSNFGTILTLWDRLHRSLRLDIPQKEITIGVPSHRDFSELGIGGTLLVPFKRPRSWALPNGVVPERKIEENKNILAE